MLDTLTMKKRQPLGPVRPSQGLTLVEILVALAVLGVVVAAAGPSLADMMERRRIVAAANELVNLFNFAKAEANATGDSLTLHLEAPIDTQTSCARLSTTAVKDKCGCNVSSTNLCKKGDSVMVREFVLPKSTGVSFEASADWGPDGFRSLPFKKNHFYTYIQNLQIAVKGKRTGAQLNVRYNNAGLTSICAQSGSMAGYSQCQDQ